MPQMPMPQMPQMPMPQMPSGQVENMKAMMEQQKAAMERQKAVMEQQIADMKGAAGMEEQMAALEEQKAAMEGQKAAMEEQMAAMGSGGPSLKPKTDNDTAGRDSGPEQDRQMGGSESGQSTDDVVSDLAHRLDDEDLSGFGYNALRKKKEVDFVPGFKRRQPPKEAARQNGRPAKAAAPAARQASRAPGRRVRRAVDAGPDGYVVEEEPMEEALEYVDDAEEGQDLAGPARRPVSGKRVDLVTVASLAPWLEDGVRHIGRKRVKSILEVYASMGGITTDLRDVLLQLVSMDETEAEHPPVSLRDSLRFLVELDDIMWRGRQDWRRAALMSMLSTNRDHLEEE
ncbi:MAG: hypothetical protein V3S98_00515 [Dehalococcoidia bacterium]